MFYFLGFYFNSACVLCTTSVTAAKVEIQRSSADVQIAADRISTMSYLPLGQVQGKMMRLLKP